MHDFYSGKKYVLSRETSRELEISAVVDWTESGIKKKRVRHCLFSIGRRQGAKYGKQTVPKLYLNRAYPVKRSDGAIITMKLYRQEIGESGKRFLWMKKVSKKQRQ